MNVPALTTFLHELEQNNAKPWFDTHRPEYEALRRDFAALVERVIQRVAEFDGQIQFTTAKESLFRINRDVRFSNNKSPYKTQFSAAITDAGRTSGRPVYYFQIGADGVLLIAGGAYMPERESLERIRQAIAAAPDELPTLLTQPATRRLFGPLEGEQLKRPPRGYDADTPGIELIKFKSFTLHRELDARAFDGEHLEDTLVESFQAIHPLVEWLRAVG